MVNTHNERKLGECRFKQTYFVRTYQVFSSGLARSFCRKSWAYTQSYQCVLHFIVVVVPEKINKVYPFGVDSQGNCSDVYRFCCCCCVVVVVVLFLVGWGWGGGRWFRAYQRTNNYRHDPLRCH